MLLSGCVAGKEGPQGEQGPQGEAVEPGPQGPAGSDGQTGPQCPAGQNGVSVVLITKTNSDGLNDIYTITYGDGTTSTFVVTNGANGQQGIQGNPGADGHTPVITIGGNGNWFVDGEDTGFSAQGPQGKTGPTGPQGETGVSITSTYINEDCDLIVEFSDGTTSNAGHIKDVDVCTVCFHVDDEIITTRNVISGSEVSRPSLEETAGYTINNWYYLDGSIHEDWKFFGYVITEDIDLYVDLSYNTYTISFNDEFEHTISDLVVTYDHQYTLEEISQTGYTFAGWADSDGVIWDTEGIYRTSSNITLHAVWNANTYVVTLNANGGLVSPTTKNVVFHHTYNLPTPTKDGYSFLGWFYGNDQIPLSGTWKYENTDGSLGGIIVAQWTSGRISDPKFTYESGGYRLTSCYQSGTN